MGAKRIITQMWYDLTKKGARHMRFSTLLFAALINLFGSTASFGATVTIIEPDGAEARVEPVDLPKGTSGIVVHHFDQNHSTIIARAILTAPDRIRFDVFDALAQPNLPTPKILPQKGDLVILGYLYHRGAIIAPNYETYDAIQKRYDLEWVHPDLFATELAKAHPPPPTKEDFRTFCNKFALARIFVALKDHTDVVDCYSFAVIERLDLPSEGNETKLPFYTRIEKIPSSIFDFFSDEVKDYYSYYTKLVEGE
jgi:hypothetical protein